MTRFQSLALVWFVLFAAALAAAAGIGMRTQGGSEPPLARSDCGKPAGQKPQSDWGWKIFDGLTLSPVYRF